MIAFSMCIVHICKRTPRVCTLVLFHYVLCICIYLYYKGCFIIGATTVNNFPRGMGPIFVDTLVCEVGSVDVFPDCIREPGLSQCDHSNDAGVHCEGMCIYIYICI